MCIEALPQQPGPFGGAIIRSARERVIQTLTFEAGGLVLATPLYVLFFGAEGSASLFVVTALSLAVVMWSPMHNAVFDVIEWCLTGRAASARPHGLLLLHAISHEVSVCTVSLPLLMWFRNLTLGQALLGNIGLTALYTGYAYLFHIVYDRLRPVSLPVALKIAKAIEF